MSTILDPRAGWPAETGIGESLLAIAENATAREPTSRPSAQSVGERYGFDLLILLSPA